MHLSRLLLLMLPLVQPPRVDLGCRCGHATVAHEHYRTGRDCALCDCLRFRSARPALAPGIRLGRLDERTRSVA